MTEFKASKRVSLSVIGASASDKAELLNNIKRDIAQQCVRQILKHMDFQEELDQLTQDIVVTGRVHIMSHSEAAWKIPVEPPPKTPEIFSSKLFEKFMEPSFLHKMVTEGTAIGLSPRGQRNTEFAARKTNLEESWHGVHYCLTETGEQIMSKNFWETGQSFAGQEQQQQSYDNIHVFVDGDIIAYRCAATCDGRHYLVDGQRFGYKKDALAYADKHGLPNTEIALMFQPEPIDAALHNVNVTMDTIKHHYLHERKLNPLVKVFLSGTTNFRYDIYPEYKQHRKKERKPHWLEECKQFLVDQHKGFRFEGFEADDLIGMTVESMRPTGVAMAIASNDKDFTQLGGEGVEQYDFTTGKIWSVTESQAMQYFYKQILIGDTSDGIPGIPKVGNQTALKILSGLTEERDLYNAVVLAYKDRCEMTIEQAVEAVILRGRLLWLLREEDKLWEPPLPRSQEE